MGDAAAGAGQDTKHVIQNMPRLQSGLCSAGDIDPVLDGLARHMDACAGGYTALAALQEGLGMRILILHMVRYRAGFPPRIFRPPALAGTVFCNNVFHDLCYVAAI